MINIPISIIVLIIIILGYFYYQMKLQYSAFCHKVYKLFRERKENKELFGDNVSLQSVMADVLGDDYEYRDTIRSLKFAKAINMRPKILSDSLDDYKVMDDIHDNISKVLRDFNEKYKNL